MEFWEANFKDKQEMWGWQPADSVNKTMTLFKQHGLRNILIPGFGYGRNAKYFVENGFTVTGIEISETAIGIAREYFDESTKIYHGSVSEMPFDGELYDGIFSYALIHLLSEADRKKLIQDCFHQLKPDGLMVFVTISKGDFRFGQGLEVSKDTFEPWQGMTLYFYDAESIQADFGNFGLVENEEINEPEGAMEGKPRQRFWYIVCRKPNR